jgi:hypothetical protein
MRPWLQLFFLLSLIVALTTSYSCRDPEPYMGKYVGESHECVALVKYLCGAPQTGNWKKGSKVRGLSLPKGTAVATFEGPGDTYQGHAAIYIGQDSTGLHVVDQWNGQPVHHRLIYFDDSRPPQNNGNRYYVIN